MTNGISFGRPVIFDTGALSTLGVLIKNETDQVKTFTVKATFKTGDRITGTASGAVNDLLPGQRRAATLISASQLPSAFEAVRVDVDTMLRQVASTPGSTAARAITFGKPAVQQTAGMSMLDVEVTNGDRSTHTFTVQAAYLKGGELIGVASGAVNDLAAGQTKTAGLIGQGKLSGQDEVLLGIETMIN